MPEQKSVIDSIGNTPVVELRRVAPHGYARVVAKLESANPTGSMKDRLARAIVERAAGDGRLAPGGRSSSTRPAQRGFRSPLSVPR